MPTQIRGSQIKEDIKLPNTPKTEQHKEEKNA